MVLCHDRANSFPEGAYNLMKTNVIGMGKVFVGISMKSCQSEAGGKARFSGATDDSRFVEVKLSKANVT